MYDLLLFFPANRRKISLPRSTLLCPSLLLHPHISNMHGGSYFLQVYNEHKPRLAVSGWFHGALESEMADWPGHTFKAAESKSDAEEDGGGAATVASTLEQLKGAVGGGAAEGDGGGGDDGSSPSVSFTEDFVGTEVRTTMGSCEVKE